MAKSASPARFVPPLIMDRAHLVIFSHILNERDRQEKLHKTGNHPFTCATPGVPNGDKSMVLSEEHGEVCKAAYEAAHCTPSPGNNIDRISHLRTELVQLAASAIAWIESIDKERKS